MQLGQDSDPEKKNYGFESDTKTKGGPAPHTLCLDLAAVAVGEEALHRVRIHIG